MKNIDLLKKMIKEELTAQLQEKASTEDATEESIKHEIEIYGENSAKIKEMEDSIKETLDKIKELSKVEDKRFKTIEKMMVALDKTMVVADKWVGELKTVKAYQKVQPEYKAMWEEALAKVNNVTMHKIQEEFNKHVKEKMEATKQALEVYAKQQNEGVITEGVFDVVKGFFVALFQFGKAIFDAFRTVKSLPAIKV